MIVNSINPTFKWNDRIGEQPILYIYTTNMEKCDVPCVLTGANKFIKSLEDYPNDRYFI